MIFFIKIYQIMAIGSKKVESIRAVLANFDFFMEIQLRGKIVKLRSKSASILLKILNGLVKIFAETPSKVAEEDQHIKKIDHQKVE